MSERYPWINEPHRPVMDFMSLDEFHSWFVRQVQWRGPYDLDQLYDDYLAGWLFWPGEKGPDGLPWQ